MRFLEKILSQPTAPFREHHIIETLTREFKHRDIPFFSDPIGNVIVGAHSKSHYLDIIKKKTPEPLRLFMAHMDHPGFHGVEWKSKHELKFKWHGGSPTRHLKGAKVWLATRSGWAGTGRLSQVTLHPSRRAILEGTIEVDRSLSQKFIKATELYGGFRFRSPVWKNGNLIYTKAADDLVGTYAIAKLAFDTFSKPKEKAPFIGLLTRAEEVGFIGALGHFELGWLSKATRSILCISLETSRTLPGAEIGKGPVVRLGDRFTVFDPGSLHLFSEIAAAALPKKHQKRVMDGGTCEASAATVYGFKSLGVSVPLGNYHNQSFEGGPNSAGPEGPAPEFVHLDDIEGLIQLCHGLLTPQLPWERPWQKKLKEMRKGLRAARSLLQTGP